MSQTNKNQISSSIPPGEDREYFADGDYRRIDKTQIRNIVCEECKWELDATKREVNCNICGRGFKFLLKDIEEFDDHILIHNRNKKLKIKINS